MPRDTDFGVFEIGMNHSGEIRTLVDMVRPDVAMITCVEAAHMGNFKNLNEIADAKAEIMEGIVKDGSMILNLDNDLLWLSEEESQCARFKKIEHILMVATKKRILNC
ncbi:Mur ligase family protein [Psychrosphaera aquimarina]|uniref:Mur ligase family protein n=1 Tax=Psychrosphaera aquimarina TaxID=2044854 RepID=A0ABU3QYW6_9GAMM|nr:Mur ligase family protein [Psychrosphaera aquimarina]MDU0112609.1 Mur ligase family protein [Psychrosphaera aquimarina]